MSFPLRLLLPALLLGCNPSTPPENGQPLFDPKLAPDFLTETRVLEPPSSPRGNRFLTGWWPTEQEEAPVLWPWKGHASLEVVSLGGVGRTLELEIAPPVDPATSVLRIEIPGPHDDRNTTLGPFPVTPTLKIPLPDLPLGRNTLHLHFEGSARPPALIGAGLRGSLPPGEATLEGGDLRQGGESLVEVVRWVEPGTTLAGRFEAPRSPSPGQSFAVWVEATDGEMLTRADPITSGRSPRRGPLELELGDYRGFARFRFHSRGSGPAAVWRGWHLAPHPPSATPLPGPAPESRKAPPRLIIVYVMDALRADFVGHLGGPSGVSPTLDRLATEGVTFLNHHSVAPNTLPSTKALFLGRTFVSQGGWRLPSDGPAVLAERFREAGYRTGLFSGNEYISPRFGMDRGFDFVDESVLFGPQDADAGFNNNAARVHAAALAWLRSLPPDEPTFLYLHTIHPHNPYDPPEPLRGQFATGSDDRIDGSTRTLLNIAQGRRKVSPVGQERLRGLYAGSLAYNDRELGRFLAEVDETVPREETFLALTSDHGEELFEHGGVLHGYTLYREVLHIPLVLWAPARLEPERITALTSTLDLHATLLDLLGGKSPGPAPTREPAGLPAVHLASASSVKGGIFLASTARWALIWAPRFGRHWGQGGGFGRTRDAEYVFDLGADPEEMHNLAGTQEPEVAWLRSLLLAWVQQGQALEITQTAEPLDEEAQERLKALGYAD